MDELLAALIDERFPAWEHVQIEVEQEVLMPANGCRNPHMYFQKGCAGCQAVARSSYHRRATRIAQGTYQPPLPVAEVRKHLIMLRSGPTPMTFQQISAICHVHPDTLGDITRPDGPWLTVRGSTAAAIFAVQPTCATRPRRNGVYPQGSMRRLRALTCKGHSLRSIAEKLGMIHRQVQYITSGRGQYVLQETADAIAALYEVWQDLDGGNKNVRDWARRRGFHAPDAWYGVDIDDPAVAPAEPAKRNSRRDYDSANVSHALTGTMFHDELTTPELVEVVAALARRGMPDSDIFTHLRWTDDWQTKTAQARAGTVVRFRTYHDIPIGSAAARAAYAEDRKQLQRYTGTPGVCYRRAGDGPPAIATTEQRAEHERTWLAAQVEAA